MIGPIELVFTAVTALAGGIAWVAGLVLLRRGAPADPVERAPLPWIPLVLALLAVPAALPAGLLLGGFVIDGVLLAVGADGGRVVLREPGDVLATYPSGMALVSLWFLLPGLLASAALLVSRERRWPWALLLAATAWVGFGLGLVLGAVVWVPMALGALEQGSTGIAVSLVDLISSIVGGMATFGVAGACAPVAWVLAGRSLEALRTTALSTLWMPGGALLVAMVTTPPDPMTQLVVATFIGTSWLLGLGAGAITAWLRRPGR